VEKILVGGREYWSENSASLPKDVKQSAQSKESITYAVSSVAERGGIIVTGKDFLKHFTMS
jgi:hypothetical protein